MAKLNLEQRLQDAFTVPASLEQKGETGYFARPLYEVPAVSNKKFNQLTVKKGKVPKRNYMKLIDGLGSRLGLKSFWTGREYKVDDSNPDSITVKYDLYHPWGNTFCEGLFYWPKHRTLELTIGKNDGKVTLNYVQGENLPAYVIKRDLNRMYSALTNKSYLFVKPPAATAPGTAPTPTPTPTPAPTPVTATAPPKPTAGPKPGAQPTITQAVAAIPAQYRAAALEMYSALKAAVDAPAEFVQRFVQEHTRA